MQELLFICLCSFLITMVFLSLVFVWCWLKNKCFAANKRLIDAEIECLKNKVWDFTTPEVLRPSTRNPWAGLISSSHS